VRLPTRRDAVEFRDYLRAVVNHAVAFWWFVLSGALGVVTLFWKVAIPSWAWWLLAGAGLTFAQYRAYLDIKREHDEFSRPNVYNRLREFREQYVRLDGREQTPEWVNEVKTLDADVWGALKDDAPEHEDRFIEVGTRRDNGKPIIAYRLQALDAILPEVRP
jgi:hypothetical protein